MSGKESAPGGGSKISQKKVKLVAAAADDDDFDDEEIEEKAPIRRTRILQKTGKNYENTKGLSSVEDIKASKYRKRWFSSQSGSQVHQICEELLPDDCVGGYSRSRQW
ncbi:hypothetical protein AAY473_038067, partial [Plecturocebus cupreus]